LKIRTRLFVAFFLIVGLGFYLLVNAIVDDLRPRYLETMEESMVDMATLLSSFVGNQIVDGKIDVTDLWSVFSDAHKRRFSAKIYELTKTHLSMRVYVTDLEGTVIFDSDHGRDEGRDYSKWNDVMRTLQGEYGARATRTDPDDPRTSALYVAAPVMAGGEILGVLTVGKPTDSVTLFLEAARKKIIFAGILAALSVAFLGMGISYWITRPIQKLTLYANAVGNGKRVSLPRLGLSEIGKLGSAFEKMRETIEGKHYVENYVQTLTHEMKSPLSAIRGAAELLEEEMPREQRRQFLDNIRSESNRIGNLVDRLLQLSSLESRKSLRQVERIDLAELVAETVESMQPIISKKDLSVSFEQKDLITIRGERFLVRHAVANLLQNALDFSLTGEKIAVALQRKDQGAEIIIADQGPGVPDYAVDKVFDRFYSLGRPDTKKKGSGLGLTFVREAATLHGGQVRLENQQGSGARAVLTLPAIPPETNS
jgi:two-component system sensor histidine kinase CreC